MPDYWGKDLGANRGTANFDRIRIDIYRERQAGFEAFKKGDVTFRQEFTSRIWATGYDFPAITDGRVIGANSQREERHDAGLGAEPAPGPVPRPAGTPRHRHVLRLRMDEAQSLLRRLRTVAVVLRAIGVQGRGHAVGRRTGAARAAARKDSRRGLRRRGASAGLERLRPRQEAAVGGCRASQGGGWERKGGSVVNPAGEKLTVEILVNDEVFVRVDQPFVENMRAIGIDASIRLVDPAQYQARQNDFDFDMIATALSLRRHRRATRWKTCSIRARRRSPDRGT